MRVLSVALLSLGLSLLTPPARAERAEYRYDLKGRASLRVVTDDGRVRVRPGPGGRIAIDLSTVGWEIGAAGCA